MISEETQTLLVAARKGSCHADLDVEGLRLMVDTDTEPVVRVIERAMNLDEALQARKTFAFHFACTRHDLDDGRTYYVLEEESQILGVAGLHHYVWGPAENVWLAWFAIDPDRQRRGLGRRLLEFVVSRARQLGYMRIFIETYSTPEFAKARAFYEARGFSRAGGIDCYLPEGGDMVVYCKDLAAHA